MKTDSLLVTSFLIGVALLPLLALLIRLVHVRVNEREAVLVTRFGKLAATLDKAGWHFVLDRALPWVDLKRVSLRREYKNIQTVCVNDHNGTTVLVDLFLEYRIVDPARASFGVVDWERGLTNVVSHAALSVLGNRTFEEILGERDTLVDELRRETSEEIERWGIRIERVLLRNVALLPEVSQQVVRSVAARLERWKADIEEDGRQRVAMLGARTSAEIATLIAEARAAYPLALGRAFQKLKQTPRVCAAYNELYELSLLHPQRMLSFVGFKDGEIRPVDAAMLMPGAGNGVS
jgi:regulator of protease activity HflC (stomatin/prohibitin superfamily)